jgi:peroxiredoxin
MIKQRNLRLRILGLLLSVFAMSLAAQNNTVKIFGKAPDYAGFHLIIESYSDYITRESHQLGSMPVDGDGRFNFEFEVGDTTLATMRLGILEGYIFLEPGSQYEVILPPYSPLPEAELFNPYFIPEQVPIGIVNENGLALNRDIYQFDESYNQFFNKHAFELFNRGNVKLAQTIIHKLDSLHTDDQTFFSNYKKYKYAHLILLSQKRKRNRVTQTYFSHQPVLHQNPAYWALFNQLYQNFLGNDNGKSKQFKAALSNRVAFDTLSLELGKDSLYAAKEFRELVLLKGLYDAFYSEQYTKEAVISYLAQASELACTPELRKLAKNMHKKVNHLRKGTAAPAFELYTLSGKDRLLSDYKGKFVYLNFANIENHACRKDFQVLAAIHKNLRRHLHVVTIVTNDNPDLVEEFVKSNNYKWDFLYLASKGNVLKDYRIKILPGYYLIDPEGNITLAPAPGPEEDFGVTFNEASKNYKIKQLRKKQPKEKNIYDF